MIAEGGPDFFLGSGEGGEFTWLPRACWRLQRLKYGMRDDCLLVRIDPPLESEKLLPYFPTVPMHLNHLVLATRLQGGTLFPLKEWPEYVYVAVLPLKCPITLTEIPEAENILFAWGELYPSLQSALDSTAWLRESP